MDNNQHFGKSLECVRAALPSECSGVVYFFVEVLVLSSITLCARTHFCHCVLCECVSVLLSSRRQQTAKLSLILN